MGFNEELLSDRAFLFLIKFPIHSDLCAAMTRKNQAHLDKKQWFLAVLEGDIEPNTAQIAKAVGVVSRTVLTWRQRAEQEGCPTGIYDGNNGWVFPPDHLADLFGFVSTQIKPYTYRWMKETINQWNQQRQQQKK